MSEGRGASSCVPPAPRDAMVAIVLAAGHGRRFGSNKLAAPLDGRPLLSHAIDAARAAPVDRVIVVSRHGREVGKWDAVQDRPPVAIVRIDSTALSDTLKAGVDAAKGACAAYVFLGDMPRIPHDLAAQLAAAIGPSYAAMPRFMGKPGHPVLLSARALADMTRLTGDEGAGKLLRRRDDVVFIDCADPGIHFDVDHPQDLGPDRNAEA